MFRPFKRLREYRADVHAGLVAQGMSEQAAADAVGHLGDGTLLRWLIEHGGDIAAIVKMLLTLFA